MYELSTGLDKQKTVTRSTAREDKGHILARNRFALLGAGRLPLREQSAG
jgi:hypothetical protein